MAKKKEEQLTKVCKKCGKQQSILKYSKPEYVWCEPCRKKIKSVEELEVFCKDSGILFNQNLWDKCIQKCSEKYKGEDLKTIDKRAIGDYFRQYNLGQNKVGKIISDEEEIKINIQDIDKELIKFWGRFKDYTIEDYDFLQENYDSWIRECKSDTLAEKKLYKQICLQELEIQKLREQGRSVVKETESLQKLMDSANVKPKDINAANDPSNASVLGMIIKDIELYRPAEYFEDKKLYLDFDGIKEYLNRFVFRPLKNLLIGSRDFDKEFNLEIDSDNDE